ncbi:MAG: FeoB-associated Cys-rich membrane protein [Clostridium argentinense]|uniref:FeoB-associated Cys-rich membrane protein n=1 Tax=Clostridium faecium TaxID=2762223 RepID=A0ABR8YRG4_9CLOT|nr:MULTISPECIES: FeoB-associated Cys-rich membrane protein [Clostridium]MBD8046844.1 FeoB-associated Cys-rich membrane protein [Clostridium faecium]MBS5825325.1 FeoB-associated Cys-rich membrane protein [Clostridium argentinense]MDU1350163.1 FeoB-associated Cys-rich membrane protein [Clostridium argentinense]
MSTFIVGTLVLGAFVLVGRKVYKDKKNGNCCGGGGDCCDCHGSCKPSRLK